MRIWHIEPIERSGHIGYDGYIGEWAFWVIHSIFLSMSLPDIQIIPLIRTTGARCIIGVRDGNKQHYKLSLVSWLHTNFGVPGDELNPADNNRQVLTHTSVVLPIAAVVSAFCNKFFATMRGAFYRG